MKSRPRDVSILVALAVLTCAGFCEASTLTVSAPKPIHVILQMKDLNPIVSSFDYRRIVIDVSK